MNRQKLLGALGVVLGAGAAIYHLIDPSRLPEGAVPIYTVIGVVLAYFGKHPLAK